MKNTTTENINADILQRIEALESRNAFQDDVIDQLNQELAIHQEDIAALKGQLKALAGRMKDMRSSSSTEQDIEPPPPHY